MSPEHEDPSMVNNSHHDGLPGHPQYVVREPLSVGQLNVS
jgi:hypothetical protein